eukprot:4191825-Amphidinium_carterae.2
MLALVYASVSEPLHERGCRAHWTWQLLTNVFIPMYSVSQSAPNGMLLGSGKHAFCAARGAEALNAWSLQHGS